MSITSDRIREQGFFHHLADDAADEIDAQEAEIASLTEIIASCRDALPAPQKGESLELDWASAMASSEYVPAYIKATFDLQEAEINRLKVALQKMAQTTTAIAVVVSQNLSY